MCIGWNSGISWNIWLEFQFPRSHSFLVGFIYQPDNTSRWRDKFEQLLTMADNVSSEIVILGDFNCNTLDKRTYRPLYHIVSHFQLKQLITCVTRPSSGTIIDHIYTSCTESVLKSGVIELGISDHLPIFITRKINPRLLTRSRKIIEFRNTGRFDEGKFCNDLMNYPPTLLVTYDDPNDALNAFYDHFLGILNKHAPLKKKRVKSTQLPAWLTGDIRHARIKRDYFLKKIRNSTDQSIPYYWSQYKMWRNKVVHLIRTTKNSHIKQVLDNNSNNPKVIWKTINKACHRNVDCPVVSLIVDGVRYSESNYVAELFNSYFINIADNFDLGQTIGWDPSSITQHVSKFEIPLMTLEYVSSFLKQLDLSKATGLDGISSFFLRLSNRIIAEIIFFICNLSISRGIFPEKWKNAKLIPIHKSEETTNRANYRPISILAILSKVLETHVCKAYLSYLTVNSILSAVQFGFRPKYSCLSSLTIIHEYLINNIEKGEVNGLLMLDFSKAFDLVDHNILLQKIGLYGITEISGKWFASYLTNRTQQVHLNDYLPSPLIINTGVPQGSILGPLLFLIYINDLPQSLVHSDPNLFADDTTLLKHNSDLTVIQECLSEDLTNVSQWSSSNRMILNHKKTKFKKIYSKRKFPALGSCLIGPDSSYIEEITSGKLLGLTLDSHLVWVNQIDKIYSKIISRLFLFKQIRDALPFDSRIKFYYGLIYPHFIYGITIWGNASNELLHPLLKLQKRAARLILNESVSTPSVAIFRKLKWIPIHNLIKLRKILLVVESLRGEGPTELRNLFKFARDSHHVNTRIASTDLRIPKVDTEFAKTKLSYSGVLLFNSLPTELKLFNNYSPNCFKGKLKLFFLDLNNHVDKLEQFSCTACKYLSRCQCYSPS